MKQNEEKGSLVVTSIITYWEMCSESFVCIQLSSVSLEESHYLIKVQNLKRILHFSHEFVRSANVTKPFIG